MNAWSNKARVKGTALLALHELRRTDRTSFRIGHFEPIGKVVMSKETSLKDKMVMAALLATDELQSRLIAAYKVERGEKRNEVVVYATDPAAATYNRTKHTQELVGEKEAEVFAKFGLEFRGGARIGSRDRGRPRTLRFGPSDARELLRA
jgi:hypothetical protein